MTDHPARSLRGLYWTLVFVVGGALAYVASSGPALACCFWLREHTGWDGWYAVIYLYYPLLIWGHDSPLDRYIEFWVNALGTVGPG
jgi:hypothetical protein